MKKNYNLLFAGVILIVIVIAGYLILTTSTGQQKKTALNLNSQNTKTQQAIGVNAPKETVTLTTSGFNPNMLTIKTGTRVIWTNTSGTVGTVNSDNYPTNLLFPFLNLGRFNTDSSISVMFTKPGKYTYHNELNADQKGTVIVQ